MGEPIVDASTSFLGGQDASKDPDVIGETSYAAGINVVCKNGSLGPRWGFAKRTLTFPAGGINKANREEKTYRSIYRTGKMQARIRYVVGNTSYIVVVVSGVIFFIDINTLEVSVVEIEDGSFLDEHADRLAIAVADKYLVIHDWPAYPVIIDGMTARRADPLLYEVPISVNGTYNQNRYFIANKSNEFTAGDPKGSPATPNAPITFEEIQTPTDYFGQIFTLPTGYNDEDITAMLFLPVTDTSTGVGPLLISTKRQVFSFQAHTQRSAWENGQFGSVFIQEPGLAGLRSFDFMNSDLVYLASDGTVRSASMSRDEQSKWAKVSMSEEVSNWLNYWDTDLVKFGEVTVFKNKVFITANPFRCRAKSRDNRNVFDYAHGGFVVLDLANMTSFGVASPPVWDGLWTGVRPSGMVVVDDRMFVFSKDNYSINELYEVTPDITYDTDGDKIRQVKSVVYTKEYFASTKVSDKTLESVSLGVDDVKGDFTLSVDYRVSHADTFSRWATFKHKAPWRTSKSSDLKTLKKFKGHSFKDLNFGGVDGYAGSSITHELLAVFRKIQLRFDIEGRGWTINYVRLLANAIAENTSASIQSINTEEMYSSVLLTDKVYNDWAVGVFEE